MKLWYAVWLNPSKHFLIILFYLLNVGGFEVCDEKFCLSTDGSNKWINGIDSAQQMCPNEWILEVYDKSVNDLLSKLFSLEQMNIIDQQSKILLEMIIDNTGWIWSDNTNEIGEIYGQEVKQTNAAVIMKEDDSFKFIAKDIKETKAFICSKDLSRDNCDGWYHEGACYYKSESKHTTWYEAHNECIKNNARLAIFKNITSVESSTFIDDHEYWIALSRKTMKWSHTNAVVTYNRWSNHVILHGNSCAVALNRGTDWIPSDCHGNFILVCMRENDQSSTTLSSASSKSPGSQPFEPTASATKACSENSSISIGWVVGLVIGNSLAIALSIFAVVLLIKFWKSSKTLSSQRNSDSTSKPAVGSYNAMVVMSRSNPTYVNVDHDSKISSEADKTVRRSEMEKCDEVYETFDGPPVRE